MLSMTEVGARSVTRTCSGILLVTSLSGSRPTTSSETERTPSIFGLAAVTAEIHTTTARAKERISVLKLPSSQRSGERTLHLLPPRPVHPKEQAKKHNS